MKEIIFGLALASLAVFQPMYAEAQLFPANLTPQ